jgi:putative hydrolase of the HAD superfamily
MLNNTRPSQPETTKPSLYRTRGDSHPSIYASALERVGCAAEDAVFVGDSFEADYLGPVDAGMRAILIDPAKAHGVPASARLTSALDLVTRIGDR